MSRFKIKLQNKKDNVLSQWTAFGHSGPPGVAAVGLVEEALEKGIVHVHLQLLMEHLVVEELKAKKSVELKDAQVKIQSMWQIKKFHHTSLTLVFILAGKLVRKPENKGEHWVPPLERKSA